MAKCVAKDDPTDDLQVSRAAPLTGDELAALARATFDGVRSAVLAVSGGADSMLLLLIAELWQARSVPQSMPVHVATVDHRLRMESAAEAQAVAFASASAGFRHHTLVWEDSKPESGVQAAAREARYRLLADLADSLALPQPVALVLGHHRDDQAETLIMRLARGSGIDGLSCMSPDRALPQRPGIRLRRPLLGVSKERIAATLVYHGRTWVEDPSNANPHFERVRVRRALGLLADVGVEADAVATSARRLARARAALEHATDELSESALQTHGGAFAQIDAEAFDAAPAELQLRLLQRVLRMFGGGGGAPPRMDRLEALGERIAEGRPVSATLGGCRIERRADRILAFREAGRIGLPQVVLRPGETKLWDNRFIVSVLAGHGRSACVTVRAVPAATLTAIARTRQKSHLPPLALPRLALLTLPSFWEGGHLQAIPHPALACTAVCTAGSIESGLGLSAEFAPGWPQCSALSSFE